MRFKIGGRDFVIIPGSFSLDDVIGEKSVAKFKLYTALTSNVHFLCGTLVEIWDDDQTPAVKVFAGIVEQSDETHLTNRVMHSLTCTDWHYLSDKRVVSAVYDNTTCGAIVKDIIKNILSEEGVAGADAVLLEDSDADLSTGTIDSTLEVNNGLRLKKAGVDKPSTVFTDAASFKPNNSYLAANFTRDSPAFGGTTVYANNQPRYFTKTRNGNFTRSTTAMKDDRTQAASGEPRYRIVNMCYSDTISVSESLSDLGSVITDEIVTSGQYAGWHKTTVTHVGGHWGGAVAYITGGLIYRPMPSTYTYSVELVAPNGDITANIDGSGYTCAQLSHTDPNNPNRKYVVSTYNGPDNCYDGISFYYTGGNNRDVNTYFYWRNPMVVDGNTLVPYCKPRRKAYLSESSATNLCTNPIFATSTAGWYAFHQATWCEVTTDWAAFGSKSLKIVTSGDTDNYWGAYYHNGSIASAGKTYTAVAYLKTGPVVTNDRLRLFLCDASWRDGKYSQIYNPKPNTEYRLEITNTFPAGDNGIIVNIYYEGGTYTDGSILYIGGLMLVEGSYAHSLHESSMANDRLTFDPREIISPTTGTIGFFLYVDQGVRESSQNRYVIGHYNGRSISVNRLSFCHAMDGYWKLYIAKAESTYYVNIYDDLSVGWHLFIIRWKSNRLSLSIDGVEVAYRTDLMTPERFGDSISIGEWLNPGYGNINTAIFDFFVEGGYKSDAWCLDVWKNGYKSNKITPFHLPLDGDLNNKIDYYGILVENGTKNYVPDPKMLTGLTGWSFGDWSEGHYSKEVVAGGLFGCSMFHIVTTAGYGGGYIEHSPNTITLPADTSRLVASWYVKGTGRVRVNVVYWNDSTYLGEGVNTCEYVVNTDDWIRISGYRSGDIPAGCNKVSCRLNIIGDGNDIYACAPQLEVKRITPSSFTDSTERLCEDVTIHSSGIINIANEWTVMCIYYPTPEATQRIIGNDRTAFFDIGSYYNPGELSLTAFASWWEPVYTLQAYNNQVYIPCPPIQTPTEDFYAPIFIAARHDGQGHALLDLWSASGHYQTQITIPTDMPIADVIRIGRYAWDRGECNGYIRDFTVRDEMVSDTDLADFVANGYGVTPRTKVFLPFKSDLQSQHYVNIDDTTAGEIKVKQYGTDVSKTWASQADFDATGVTKVDINTANAKLEIAGTTGMWHFTDFAFRKKFRVNNTSGGTVTDYQIGFTVYADTGGTISLGNRCMSWPNDIRICDASGNLQTYHRLTSDATCATIWCKFASVPDGGADYYIYFGKADAADVSSTSVWLGYYDCSSISGWSPSTSGSAGYNVDAETGEIEAWSYTNDGSAENITTTATYPTSNVRHIFKVRWNNDPAGSRSDEAVDSYFGCTGYVAAQTWAVRGYSYNWAGTNFVAAYLNTTDLGHPYGVPVGSWSQADEWMVTATLTDIKMYRNGVQFGTTQPWGSYGDRSLRLCSNGAGPNKWSILRIRLDYLAIAKYMANEPTIGTVDAEETMMPPDTTGTWISEAIDLSAAKITRGATISYDAQTTNGTVSVYVSLDNGSTWSEALASGAVIPGMTDGTDVSGITQLKVKVVMVNNACGVSPSCDDIVVTVPTKYMASGQWYSTVQDLSTVRRVKTSVVNFTTSIPAGTLVIQCSLDGKTWTNCVSGQPIPVLTAGMDLRTANNKLMFRALFTTTASQTPVLSDLNYSVTTGYEWSGARVTTLDLNDVGFASDDSMFDVTFSNPTGCNVYTATCFDGASWQDQYIGPVTNLTQEFNCVGKTLYIRTVLSSLDGQDTPVISRISVTVPCALIQDGVGVDHAVFPYESVTSVMNTLASSSGYWWMIDEDKRLHFKSPKYYKTSMIIDNTVVVPNSLQVKNRAQVYRNRQYVKGGKDITVSQTETRQGDGKTKAFTMGYPLAEKPSAISVNGVAKTVGVLGSDTDKDFYYQKGSNVITAAAILETTDTLSVTYRGEYDLIVVMSDYGEIAETAAREGGNTTGIVEAVENNLNINSRDNAVNYAASVLSAKAKESRIITFKTLWGGIEAGMITLVNWPSIGEPFEALVQSVKYSIIGDRLVYDVTAVEGPDGGSWTEYFAQQTRGLTDKTIRINIGGSDILLSTANWSDTTTLTDSVTFQTFDCPIIGDSLSASNTTYPG